MGNSHCHSLSIRCSGRLRNCCLRVNRDVIHSNHQFELLMAKHFKERRFRSQYRPTNTTLGSKRNTFQSQEQPGSRTARKRQKIRYCPVSRESNFHGRLTFRTSKPGARKLDQSLMGGFSNENDWRCGWTEYASLAGKFLERDASLRS